MKDPYEVIGVPREATKEEIAAAYRQKARAVHPDRNPGDPEAGAKLRELNEAHAILSDDEKRAAHDRTRAGQGRFHVHFGGMGFDFSADPFGTASSFRQVRIPPGKDVELEIRLSLKESVLGTMRLIRSNTGPEIVCPGCSGTRTAPGSRRHPCPSCAGTGAAFYPGRGGINSQCRQCGGHGDIPLRKCGECDGAGKIKTAREVNLRIPSGVSEGQKLRLAGQGEASPAGGPPGDMYVNIRVDEDKDFVRKGSDLYTTIRVPFHVAVSRQQVRVPGIDGAEYMIDAGRIVPGVTTAVIQNAGVPSMTGSRGRLFAVVQVDLPEPKTARGALLMAELLDELSGKKPSVPSPDD